MKALRFLLFLMMATWFLNSCRKDNSGPSSADPIVPKKIEDLAVKSTFDWRTIKEYKLSLSGSSSHTVQIKSSTGAVYYKGFILANTLYNVTVSLPTYEKSLKLVFNGENIDLPLTSTNLIYSFK